MSVTQPEPSRNARLSIPCEYDKLPPLAATVTKVCHACLMRLGIAPENRFEAAAQNDRIEDLSVKRTEPAFA